MNIASSSVAGILKNQVTLRGREPRLRLVVNLVCSTPHPYAEGDRIAGNRYDVSILQVEFALTQVLDRPRTGRLFFEQVQRENLDLGPPDQIQLIFHRRVTRRRPGRFTHPVAVGEPGGPSAAGRRS